MELPRLRIAILHYQPKREAPDPVVGQLTEALGELGHEAVTVAVADRVPDILRDIGKARADLVLNVCETFAEDYRMEVNVAALMEMGRVKFTGSGTAGLLLAQDKVLAKQLLAFHRVPTPSFVNFDARTFETSGNLRFPLIVKPARSDASIGIGRHSVVGNWEELIDRVRDIRDGLQDDALAEEFIEGREIYAAIVGTPTHPEVLPLVEMDFKGRKGIDRVSDREVKFAPETEATPSLVIAELPEETRAAIERLALITFRALQLKDYARIDFRISTTGQPYVLEANPNPYLDKAGELAVAARDRGVEYPKLVESILRSAAERYRLFPRLVEENRTAAQ
jgi:D-alanine-D-alanine ligase